VLLNPLFLKTAERFICTPVETWVGNEKLIVGPELRIGATQAIQIGPGEGAQPLHRDDMAFLWRHPQYGREARCQIMIAVSDFTAENGGTLVIPGSNHWDDDRQPKLEEAISTEMKAGSGLIWIGSTYHGGGNNRTDTPRTGVTVTLDASNLRQEENMYLSLSPETVKSYPEQIQRLLGWSSGKNYMGWVEIDGQMADPILMLENV
jgi:ectoine hydroxylase-related dioxygenase (phytanoyl-CoA dioxygenase family)